MVRAATAGMIDFTRFDPWDMWWWKKLKWTITELEAQQSREVALAQHNHWVTIASHSNLVEESFEKAKVNATTSFNQLLKLTYPWLADRIGEDGTKTDREEAVEAYHEIFGRPGEERYEQMVDQLAKSMRKLSPREKDKARKMRKLKRQQRLQERFGED